ncbi:MAG TPA: hypothetical protein IAB59_01750, partial [Candidatus Onthousia faecipullorum]|nr:hypothetical protein [Candidatus Onthousia faecipullorum]
MIKNKKSILILGLILLMVIAIVGVSYAAYTYTGLGQRVNTITTGSITMTYTETDNVINLEGALPTTDKTGKTLSDYFEFTVSSSISGDVNINYEISAKKESGTLEDRYIKLYLTRVTENSEEELMTPETYNEEASSNSYTGRPANEMSLYTSSMNSSESNTYRLRMYVDESYNPQGDGGGKTFSVRINVYGQDGVNIEPNAPELDSNMIAVRYDGSNWVKADSSTNNWYNYDKQEWANAVTVSSSTRDTYLSAPVGTAISMDDIETLWVWIPRYSYTIGSEDGTNYYGKQGDYLDSIPTQFLPGEIDIKFVSTSTKDRGTAKYVVSDGIQSNSWYTPDAFTFGDEELSGIWVGKFETSSSNPSATDGGGNVTTLDAMIKPNVTSWRNINVSNIHTVATKVSASGNRYGFSESMNSHAMKNSEWAVVSYLSQSRYGKLGNENFTGANKEVYQNKSDQYITGCSYGSPSNGNTDYGCQYTYDNNIRTEEGMTGKGVGASTTGTIYGVYDMSGGAWEYVMGNYNDISASSGFSEPLTLESKYYDKYTSNDVSLACNGSECLSHGLSETAGWYNDYRNMVSEEYPWLLRGG